MSTAGPVRATSATSGTARISGAASYPWPFKGTFSSEQLLVEHLTEHDRDVEWDTELTALTVAGTDIRAAIRRRDGTQETIYARWVVGADGARSPVRHALGIGFAGGTFPQTGLLADVELALPPGQVLPPGTLRLNLTRGGFVGIFGLSNGRHRLFGAVPPSLAPRSDDGDVSHEAYTDVSLAAIQRWLDDYFAVDARIHRAAWTALFRIHSRIADRFQAGNVFLVGDAAHIHSPAGGQGMNLAVGDAFNLGWKLALVANGQAHRELLGSYDAERHPVARTVLRGSPRGFALETMPNPIAGWVRAHVATRLVGPLTRLSIVRAAIFSLFAQTWIRYPRSPAVAREPWNLRSPRPGDRAPYGHFAPPDDRGSVFEVCGGVRHHVLLFEGITPDPHASAQRHAIEGLLARYAIDITVHPVPAGQTALHRRYRARRPRLFLIRPDGHLAYSGAPDDLSRLGSYLDRLYVRSRTP